MIEAHQQGRSLRLVVTDSDDPDFIPESFVVRPVSAVKGRQMSFRYLMALNGLPLPEGESIEKDMRESFGVENALRAEFSLTLNEAELVAQAGYMWNLIGGSQAVDNLLRADANGVQGGVDASGEALAVFKLRMVPLLSQISHLSESGHRMREAGSPDTSTPQGGGSSESEPVSPHPGPRIELDPSGSTSTGTTDSGSSSTP